MNIDFSLNNATAIVGAASIVVSILFLAKKYFNGAVCKTDRDLSGKVIIVTGGNAGLGKATIELLAQKNCTIIFGARDARKAEQVIKQIKRKNPKVDITYYPLDLGNLQSVDEFSQLVKHQVQKVDVLINNAATFLVPKRTLTRHNFEVHMGINHLGHFYLTHKLWPLIKKADKPRIINVSSIGHRGIAFPFNQNIQIPFDDLHFTKGYDPGVAYGRSKAANILFTKQLQRRMDEQNFEGYSYSLHPGIARTEAKDAALIFKIARIIVYPIYLVTTKSAKQGSQTTLYTILQDESKLKKGAYYADCKGDYVSDFAQNMNNALKIWELSESELKISFKI